MASYFDHFLLFGSLLFFISPSIAKTSFRPKALVLPVFKDSLSLQYLTHISQRTPVVPVKLTVDLGGLSLYVNCEQDYVSSSYRPVPCGSAQCNLAGVASAHLVGCNNNTCFNIIDNTIAHIGTQGGLSEDVVSLQSTDGKNPGKVVTVPRLLFTCSDTSFLYGLASGVKGMAGLGRTNVSLPSLFSAKFNFDRKFSICLSSSTRAKGAIFFGDGPYVFLPDIDVSKFLLYTPLILNPVGTGFFFSDPSTEYFIGVKSIKINGKTVPINTTLLSINREGFGGTKISTVNPYTLMKTSIYNTVIEAFVKELGNIPRVPSVAPFGACFSSKNIGSTRVGPAVPPIDLVLQNKRVYWRIFGANSMVQVSNEVMCLGIVDGGSNPMTSIVIGGHQLEDNLLQFDLATSKLGFSSSLLLRQTACSNFNFTLNA